jgi:hypothetical protein
MHVVNHTPPATHITGGIALCLLALLVTGALVWAGGASGRASVVGGTQADIQQAPWQVAVIQTRGRSSSLCGGFIIDAVRVVTAAHCVYDQGGQQAPFESLAVRAGISNFLTPRASDSEQSRLVTSYRVHPGYSYATNGSPDDIAVLLLDTPLDLTGGVARAIALPAAGTVFAGGEAVSLAGFGRQSANSNPDGTLNRMDGTLAEPGACGPNNAVLLCASGTNSTVCSGDSGSALTIGSPDRVVIGVASTGPLSCRAGGTGAFTNVAAPEILRFVQGEDSPPTAPRREERAVLSWPEAMQVGQTLTCSGGEWTGSPTFSYTFFDPEAGTTLQSGPASTYTLRLRDVGRTIACRASAANEGGVGTSQSEPVFREVQPAAKVSAATVAARRGGTASMRVTLSGGLGVRGRAQICIRPSLKVGTRVCRTTRLVGASRTTTSLKVPLKATAPATTVRVAVTAELADGRKLGTTGFIRVDA